MVLSYQLTIFYLPARLQRLIKTCNKWIVHCYCIG